jgi:hypothetical protein
MLSSTTVTVLIDAELEIRALAPVDGLVRGDRNAVPTILALAQPGSDGILGR